MIAVGSVPYVNAYPLVGFGHDDGIEVLYDVPSKLQPMLDDGRAQAILVSSYFALTQSNTKICPGVCIGSYGPVKSVRLFSKVAFAEIKSLALDASSMTSNRLALILLRSVYGCEPVTINLAPSLDTMLEVADAAVLIGDIGMDAEGSDHHVLDLGEAWTSWTGLPFVWALWTGFSDLTPDLAFELVKRYERWDKDGDEFWRAASAQSGWSISKLKDYLLNTMRYELDQPALQGLARFRLEIEKYEDRILSHPVFVESLTQSAV